MKPLVIIFIVAIIARFIFYFAVYQPFSDKFNWGHYPGQFNMYSDDNYDEIARNLISGKGYTKDGEYPNIVRTPVYPLILAMQFFLFGDGFFINVFINILYQSLVCIILYYLTIMIFNNNKIAIISSLIWAVYPLPMLQAMGPNTEPIYELFLIFFAYFFYKFYKFKKIRHLIYSSILLLIMTMTRPISILFPVYFLLITLFIKDFIFITKIKQVIILFVIFLIGVVPWIYRGYTITGEILPLVSYKPITYYLDKEKYESNELLKTQMGYPEKLREGIKKPTQFVKNFFIRLVRFWYYGHSTPVRIVNALLQFPILLLSVFGIWWSKKRKILILPIILTICYFWLAYGATHAISRYSFPMIALLSPFIAIGIIKIFKIMNINALFADMEI